MVNRASEYAELLTQESKENTETIKLLKDLSQ
jgi:hypothetical protein